MQPLTRGPEASDTPGPPPLCPTPLQLVCTHCTPGCAQLKRRRHSAARSTCAAAFNNHALLATRRRHGVQAPAFARARDVYMGIGAGVTNWRKPLLRLIRYSYLPRRRPSAPRAAGRRLRCPRHRIR